MFVNKDLQIWLLIEPIRSQICKSLLTNMDFNVDISKSSDIGKSSLMNFDFDVFFLVI